MKFDPPAQQIVMQETMDTVLAFGTRVAGLEQQIEHTAQASRVWPVIEALAALRGVNLLTSVTAVTAVTAVTEIGDVNRFARASQLMAPLRLVPSETSSGGSTRRGGITETGNSHVRQVLVEAAWTYRHGARKTAGVQQRAERTPEVVQDIAKSAQKRLCQRYRTLEGKGKLKVQVQVCTALARELAGFIWAIGQVMPVSDVAAA